MAAVFVFTAALFVSAPVLAQTDTNASPPVTTVTILPRFLFDIFTSIMLALTRLALSLMLFVLTFVIEVAGYNGFLSSTAVNVGWVMVRDLTNMIFVVALLMIAFGTILGIEHYEWKHMLFKLVSAAILVNFSRIICGILIDVAQVVMITFVNGIAATVGGNFIRAFNLDKLQSLSTANSAGAVNAEEMFLASAASLFISVTILVTMAMFLAMLVARVIVLWILIVLSPIAFVFGVLHQTEHYAQEWWSEFGKNVITGPVLIFFLWLTLVTVGNGMINQEIKNNSATPKDAQIPASSASGIGEAMTWDNLVNFVIAVGMLVVGLRVTSHLGGVGAQWTEHAMDYGKSVTRWASGMALAQKGAQKVGQVAHEAYEKKVEMYGGAVKNLGQKWWAEHVTEGRIKKASDRMGIAYSTEKNEDGTPKYSKWQKLKARAALHTSPFTPDIVKQKIFGSLEKATEYRLEGLQHLASASKTPWGKMKLEEEMRLHDLEESGQDIKHAKDVAEHKRRHGIYTIAKDENLTDKQKAERLKQEFGLNETQAADAIVIANRKLKAIRDASNAKQDETIHHKEVGIEKAEYEEKQQSEIKLDGIKVTGTSSPARKSRARQEIRARLAAGEISQAEADQFEKSLNTPGGVYELRAKKWGNFKTVADAHKAQAEIESELNNRVAAGMITKEQAADFKKKIKPQFEYQEKLAEIGELTKQEEQIEKRVGTFAKRTEAGAEQGLMTGSGQKAKEYQAREKKINEFSHDMQQIQTATATKKELELLQGIRDILAKGKEKDRAVQIAKLSGDRDFQKLLNEQQNLKIRAVAAREQKNMPMASQLEQQADSLIMNKITEGFKNAGHNDNERGYLAASIAQKQKELQDIVAKGGVLNDQQQKDLKQYTQQKVALTTVNAQSGAYAAQRDMSQTLHAIGWNEGFTEENQMRRWLSAQLGKVVKVGEEDKAKQELEDILGKDEFNATKRHMAVAAKKQLSEGNRDYVVFAEGMDAATGRTQYDIDTKPDPKTGTREAVVLSTIRGWKSKKDLKVSSVREAMGAREFVKDSSGKTTPDTILTSINDNEAATNADLVSGMTSQTISRLEGGLLGDINDSNITEEDFRRQMREFAKVVADDKALIALGKQLKKKMDLFKITEVELEDIYKKENP